MSRVEAAAKTLATQEWRGMNAPWETIQPDEQRYWLDAAKAALAAADALSMEEPGHISRDLRVFAEEELRDSSLRMRRGLVIEAASLIDAQARALGEMQARVLELQAALKPLLAAAEYPFHSTSAIATARAALNRTTGGGDVE